MRPGKLESSLLFQTSCTEVVKIKAMAVFQGQDDIFSVVLLCNSLSGNSMAREGNNGFVFK